MGVIHFIIITCLLTSFSVFSDVAPLPPEPEVKPHVLFQLWHSLRDLRGNIPRLVPENGEDFIYQSMVSLAPNLERELLAHEEMYRILLRDYQVLVTSGFVEKTDVDLSPIHKFRIEVAEQIHSYSLSVNLSYAKLLTILHKKLWDHRYISTFFFTTSVDRRHKPLESVSSLTRSSVRASKVVERLFERQRLLRD